MARGINKVILVGNIGQDPEVRFMPSGGAVCNLSLATSDSWKDKQTGQMQDRTEWHRLVFFNRLAEIVGQYLRKGSKIYAEGSLRTRKWQDQQGQERTTVEIVVSDMQMLDGRGQMGDAPAGGDGYQNYSNNPSSQSMSGSNNVAPASSPSGGFSGAPQAPAAAEPALTDFDDDIPF